MQKAKNKWPSPAPAQSDALTPHVPPTYPPAPKPSLFTPDVPAKTPPYRKLIQYLSTNYKVSIPRRLNPHSYSFHVRRYTDKYDDIVTNPDLVPRVGATRLPSELVSTAPTTKQNRSPTKPKVVINKNILDQLPEDDEASSPKKKDEGDDDDDEDGPKAKKAREEAAALNDVLEEGDLDDLDEELDIGTDYATNYFDNGEDFLESDDDAEDGPTY